VSLDVADRAGSTPPRRGPPDDLGLPTLGAVKPTFTEPSLLMAAPLTSVHRVAVGDGLGQPLDGPAPPAAQRPRARANAAVPIRRQNHAQLVEVSAAGAHRYAAHDNRVTPAAPQAAGDLDGHGEVEQAVCTRPLQVQQQETRVVRSPVFA
jgi:hypothetical protein